MTEDVTDQKTERPLTRDAWVATEREELAGQSSQVRQAGNTTNASEDLAVRLIPAAKVERAPTRSIIPNPRNARTHSEAQVRQIAASIERFGFTNPILTDDRSMILAGHGRLEAARLLGMSEVPVLRLSHLSDAERRAYVLADNKLALNAGWDRDLLASELQGLIDLDFEVELTGFSAAEIDFALDAAADARPDGDDAIDRVPELIGPSVTRPGDLWVLGRHRLVCGNARSAEDFSRLMDSARAHMIFTDPPYNVRIDGHV